MTSPLSSQVERQEPAAARRAVQAVVTQSAHMRHLISQAIRAANSSATILLTGESGTGKELFSRIIHENSPRHRGRLVSINCAALPPNLVESELFGHEKGAFTDAIHHRVGRFEFAAGGTLFLDEITEMPITTQTKLLRALESNEIQRIGSNEVIKTDIRVIASTNRPIPEFVKQGKFRLDLYHRINIIDLCIPPLRDRRVDIPLLATHFIEQFKAENSIPIRGLTKAALTNLSRYHWPGNIRELRNAIHRACVLTTRSLVDIDCFEQLDLETEQHELPVPNQWLEMRLDEIERQVIMAALTKFGSKRLAAETLGVTSRTLTNKLKQYSQTDHPPIRRAA